MLAWSPILIQKIEIHALGFVLRKLQLNRHRHAEVSPHRHDFAQLILYLSGEGAQSVGSHHRVARTGDLFVIPPSTPHGFTQQGNNLPVCLVVDYDSPRRAKGRPAHRRLPSATLNELHAQLSRIPAKGRLRLADYAAILAVVARLLDQAPAGPAVPPTLFERIREQVRSPRPLTEVARSVGYHPDHLNRKLKHEAGLGLRALRDRVRLESAQSALRGAASVAEAAVQCGFEDPNYFARWFRRQTGRTPSAWRR